MTTPAHQTVPDAGTATPQEPLQSNTPPTTEQPAETAQENKPQYVTAEDLEKREAELLRRFKQSNRDRNTRIDEQLAGIRQLLEKPGVQLTPDQEATLREDLGNRYDAAETQDEPRQVQAPNGDQLVAQFVSDVFAETGTQVTVNDPEWKDLQKVIDASWNDPKGGVKVTAAAIKAATQKAERLKADQESAPVRVVGGGGESSPGIIYDPKKPASYYLEQVTNK